MTLPTPPCPHCGHALTVYDTDYGRQRIAVCHDCFAGVVMNHLGELDASVVEIKVKSDRRQTKQPAPEAFVRAD